MIALLDGTFHILQGGASFSVFAERDGSSPSVVSLGCCRLAGVSMEEASSICRDLADQVLSDIMTWIGSGAELPPWRGPESVGSPQWLEITAEWRALNRRLKKKARGG